MLRRIEDWAVRERIAVRLTGIDLNPLAVRAAREFTPTESRIRWIVGEMESIDTLNDPIDLVISSLFTHHLADDAIVRFLAWMERVARLGWFINDLYRSRISYFGFKSMAMVARWHRFVRHDGPVSIRRAFLPAEWERYAEASGLDTDVDPYRSSLACAPLRRTDKTAMISSLCHDALIIGGGPAGSTLAIALANAGRHVVLIEKSKQAHHKVCGEFLSPESLPLLRLSGVHPERLGAQTIHSLRVAARDVLAEVPLPAPALSLTRGYWMKHYCDELSRLE